MQKLILQPRTETAYLSPETLARVCEQIVKAFDEDKPIVVVPAGYDLFLLDDEGITLLTPQVQLPE